VIIAGYLGTGKGFVEAVVEFGDAYAAQTESDWKELCHSRRAGTKVQSSKKF